MEDRRPMACRLPHPVLLLMLADRTGSLTQEIRGCGGWPSPATKQPLNTASGHAAPRRKSTPCVPSSAGARATGARPWTAPPDSPQEAEARGGSHHTNRHYY